MFELTEKMKDKMLHAAGLNRAATSYRNYYNTQVDDPEWVYLVGVGLASGPHVNKFSSKGYGNFCLTELGKDLAYGIKRRMKEGEEK